ncbi:DUF6434 domain-containing protein [Gracilibacillus xinjiangensis]|uniref:DUF6434 domain-containing protein n=1 Tax=Gracilibacillus xinjiangensis TaxID=1193282 RepID=A0ABV8WVI8_9BACI
MRPNLTKTIKVEDFQEYYWLKKELQQFCREHGISAAGSKVEIADRIVTFLKTGERKKPARKTRVAISSSNTELSLDTIIAENHRCSQQVRAFFQSLIPNFHFSTHIQNYFKQNAGKTYRDVVEEWNKEKERKKDPSYKKEIGPQFEYNQFIRDFFEDKANHAKTREDAIAAWNHIKKLPGNNKYSQHKK